MVLEDFFVVVNSQFKLQGVFTITKKKKKNCIMHSRCWLIYGKRASLNYSAQLGKVVLKKLGEYLYYVNIQQ